MKDLLIFFVFLALIAGFYLLTHQSKPQPIPETPKEKVIHLAPNYSSEGKG